MQTKHDYLYYIIKTTKEHNLDNITRTKAYQNFYLRFPEIKWSFIASIVSRNAGWNMTDLRLPAFQTLLGKEKRERLFMTYERANWLIFSDAYPQLLLYQLSKQQKTPLFHLLPELRVSRFMANEWYHFWQNHDDDRLMIALIINEQNVIQLPVIKQTYFKYRVFLRLPYLLQDFLFMNAVLLPTRSTVLYGSFVHDFTNLTKRVNLGKRLATMIFHPDVYGKLLDFARNIEHTGSRRDYERFLNIRVPKSPLLRVAYPIISHQDTIRNDWYVLGGMKNKWLEELPGDLELNDVGSSFYHKRKMLFAYCRIKNAIMGKSN
ncbi:DUF2515 domain-containing protein [Virgibacillus dakarensis]|uniref:DUF2515 domain-containing protein n=1 Tax=Lentibacillus populi TaxID=1827502 RepID=A0A9W5TVJ0_9BACI|nr:DUF2515 family protein [Lentibacillus populi]MBT2214231.1 DUF2515 domain-containing protein [Virgibacillus dakarensis]MTW85944.1 DUF2515 domain-containing protein [Virgibacillus dakarensis]GGB33175.1 hypothetical protein GCM10011409_08270 [Lentibacillus populi]